MLNNIEEVFIDDETISVIGEFSIIWAMMEEKYFDRDCNARKLSQALVTQSNEFLTDCAKR